MHSSGLPRPSPDVVYRELEGEVVLVHLKSNRIFALSQTGARLWELLAAGVSRDEIRRRLLEEFAVDAAQLDREVDELFVSLRAEQLVT